jgi:hypothetical protein
VLEPDWFTVREVVAEPRNMLPDPIRPWPRIARPPLPDRLIEIPELSSTNSAALRVSRWAELELMEFATVIRPVSAPALPVVTVTALVNRADSKSEIRTVELLPEALKFGELPAFPVVPVLLIVTSYGSSSHNQFSQFGPG